MFQSICTAIITNVQKSLWNGSGWITDSVIDHTVSISKYNPLAGSSYPRKGLVNVQNIDDNECFKWRLLRYLDPADHNPRRFTKADNNFAKRLDFKDIKFSVKIKDIHKIEKKKKEEFHQH